MTKQEEIKEVIDAYTDDECLYPDKDCECRNRGYCVSTDDAYKCLMKRLDEIGLVLKVDRELPDEIPVLPKFFKQGIITEQDLEDYARVTEIQNRMVYIKAGLKFVEPLIEEK